jgi:transcriptional regulator with XRE-family HTH domain
MGPVEINIGSKIKKLRLARGLRQQDVARMTDLSLSMISQVENNRVSPLHCHIEENCHFTGHKYQFLPGRRRKL